jgi:hypothetical protein
MAVASSTPMPTSRKLLFVAIALLVVLALSIMAALFAYNFAHRRTRSELYVNVATFQKLQNNHREELQTYAKTLDEMGFSFEGSGLRLKFYLKTEDIPAEFLSKIPEQIYPRIEKDRYQIIVIFKDRFPSMTSVWTLKSDFEMPIFLFQQ